MEAVGSHTVSELINHFDYDSNCTEPHNASIGLLLGCDQSLTERRLLIRMPAPSIHGDIHLN